MEDCLSYEDLFLPHDELFRENRDSQTGKRAHKTLRVFEVCEEGVCVQGQINRRDNDPLKSWFLCEHDVFKDLSQVGKKNVLEPKRP